MMDSTLSLNNSLLMKDGILGTNWIVVSLTLQVLSFERFSISGIIINVSSSSDRTEARVFKFSSNDTRTSVAESFRMETTVGMMYATVSSLLSY